MNEEPTTYERPSRQTGAPKSFFSSLLGDPGLGKSTLSKDLALRWASERSRPLTLVVELRLASRRATNGSYLDYLEAGASPVCFLPRNDLDQYLKANPALLIFDGLDEAMEPARTDAVSEIIKFCGEYPELRVIVTTRIQGYYPGSTHPEEFRNAGFKQFTLQDFSDHERDEFIDRWYAVAFADPLEAGRYKRRLRRGLDESYAICELASIPLLLTMMAILSRKEPLPRERHRLYEKCAELLLEGWDLEKFPERKATRRESDVADRLGPDQKSRILERVAAAMQEGPTGLEANLISAEKLSEIVQDELTQLGFKQPWSVAADLIEMLRERNFMLAYFGNKLYGFLHRTFQEFLCARDFKYRLDQPDGFGMEDLKALFRNGWRKDELHEVLRLLCGLLGPAYAINGVSELVNQGKDPDGYRSVLLATQCLREIRRQVGEVPQVRDRVRQELLALAAAPVDGDLTDAFEVFQQVVESRFQAVHELVAGWKDDPITLV